MDLCVKVQRELFSGLGAKYIVLLRAYLDESGLHADPGVVVVAGAITTANSWDSFSAKCVPFLKKQGVKFFGTSDFFASKNEFDGWDEPRKMAFLKKFMPIVNTPKKVVVGHGVKLAEFETVRAEFPKVRITKYQYCLEKCLAAIMHWAWSKPKVEPIAVIIEAGNKTGSQTFRLFNAATDYPWLQQKYKLASISVQPKQLPTGEYIYPFQVADIVANSIYKHHKAILDAPGDTFTIENTLLPLLKPKERFGYMDTPDKIREWFQVAQNSKEYLEQVGEKI